jgi:hypothetical protein
VEVRLSRLLGYGYLMTLGGTQDSIERLAPLSCRRLCRQRIEARTSTSDTCAGVASDGASACRLPLL